MNMRANLALGVFALAARCTAETLDLSWGMKLATGQEILTIGKNGEVLASACSRKLKIDELRVELDSDTQGAGTLTLGDDTYDLGDDSLCSASWNDQYIEVNCHVPFEGDFFSASTVDGIAECFGSEEVAESFATLNSDGASEEFNSISEEDMMAEALEETSVNERDPEALGLVARQNNGCGTGVRTVHEKSNPPLPHKYRGWKQVTQGLNCANGVTCTVTRGETWSVSHTASFGVNGMESWGFFSAGYSVSYTTGGSTTMGCSAIGGRVCLRHMQRYQKYMVDEYRSLCGAKVYQRTYSIRAPVNNNRGEWWCHRGTNDCANAQNTFKWGDAGSGVWN